MNTGENIFNWLTCPVVFICSKRGSEKDIMTGTAMFVSEKEPLLSISVAQGHMTERLITESGSFVLALAAESQKKLAIQVGSSRGDQLDKYHHFGIKTLSEEQGSGLVPEDSAAWMKCRVEHVHTIKGYQVILGRVENYGDLDQPPLIWRDHGFFKLTPL